MWRHITGALLLVVASSTWLSGPAGCGEMPLHEGYYHCVPGVSGACPSGMSCLFVSAEVGYRCFTVSPGRDGGMDQPDTGNTPDAAAPPDATTAPDAAATGCAATCTQPGHVCVGSAGHQSCVPECDSSMSCADGDRSCCYGGCVDLQNDPNNCGDCLSYCAESCVNGACVDACGNLCGAEQECCGGTCVNTETDVDNCGSCGFVCDPLVANTCSNGQCTCAGGAECTGGRRCCSSGCKDTSSDPMHCGACGAACAQGEDCLGGGCSCAGGPACSSGEACCSGGCADLGSDDDNCGYCGNSCDNGNTCNQGSCDCAGQTCTSGPLGPATQPAICCGASGCVEYSHMTIGGVENCGSCGNDCTLTEVCSMGSCVPM